jgi:hypothetical protein
VLITTIAPPVSQKHGIIFPGFIKQRGTKGEEGTSFGVNYISSCMGREPDSYRGFLSMFSNCIVTQNGPLRTQ